MMTRLPFWQRFDFALIALMLLSLLANLALLLNPAGLPNGSDVLYHTYRVAEMDRSWMHQTFFPHWAEGMYYGYGSPLFHYYAGITYSLSSLLIRILNLSALDSLRVLIVLMTQLGAVGMYFLARRMSGYRLGGLIAGMVFVFAPYMIFTEPYARGTYPEILALSFLPWVLWRFQILMSEPKGRHFMFASVSVGLLILMHNLMALVGCAMVFGWVVWTMLASIRAVQSKDWLQFRPGLLALLSLGLGVGLAAFFWLPVILEGDAVSLDNLTAVALLDFRNFFSELPDLFGLAPMMDAGRINGLDNVIVIGIAQWGLALSGLIGFIVITLKRWKSGEQTVKGKLWTVAYWPLLAVVFIFLMLHTSSGLWENIRYLAYLQFPWRLLGPLVIVLGLLAGLNAVWLSQIKGRIANSVIVLMLLFIILSVLPLYFVPEWTNIAVDTSIEGYHQAEVAGLQRGTTFTDEYRPKDVSTLADPTPSLLADYADGYPINKISPNLPEGVKAELITNGVESNEWRIQSEQAFTMEVLIHYWAGWQAEVDGALVPISPSPNHGFITFPVPEGQHQVKVYLGWTAARLIGIFMSLIALVLVLGATALLRTTTIKAAPALSLNTGQRMSVLIGGMLACVGLFILLRPGIAYFDSPIGEAYPASEHVNFTMDDQFQLIGYDINGREFKAGDTVKLNAYWFPLKESDINFSSFLHISQGGPPPAQQDKLHPAGRAIQEWWKPEGYIFDPYRVVLPAELPSGEYQVYIGFYTCELMPPGDCGNGYRPEVKDAEGNMVGDTIPLGTIKVNP